MNPTSSVTPHSHGNPIPAGYMHGARTLQAAANILDSLDMSYTAGELIAAAEHLRRSN